MSSLIKLNHVSKTYRVGTNVVSALTDVNLRICRGELVAIIGTSGSGKSTLMNIMGFLDKPSAGEYWYDDRDVSNLNDDALADIRNQEIGFVFQSFFLLPRLTALQNVMLPLFYRGTDTQLATEKAMAMLDKVAVAELAHHRPNQLSGGQQQRVAIARALVGDPKVILADEPTGALDTDTGNDVMSIFQSLHEQEGRTIIIITHDKDISRRSQRVVSIKDGAIMSAAD